MPQSDEGSQSRQSAILTAIRDACSEIAEIGRIADRDNTDPAAAMELLHQRGATELFVPTRYGGVWDGTERGGWAALIRAIIDITAGDGAVGQNWTTTASLAMHILQDSTPLPGTTRDAIAKRLLDAGLRITSSTAPGGDGPVIARAVTGGVTVSGTKSFNTNSAGEGLAVVSCQDAGGAPYSALVELSHPDVELHGDWDNMGQRGTGSQRITYHNVFVPDGWHLPGQFFPRLPPSFDFLAGIMLEHAAMMQGIGEGAMEAFLGYVRTMRRGSLPRFATPADDPLMLRRIGELSARLSAARALIEATADRVSSTDEDTEAIFAAALRAKLVSVRVALDVSADMFDITGGSSTASKFGLDRFWRNARTGASHDPTDALDVAVGTFALTGKMPALQSFFRI